MVIKAKKALLMKMVENFDMKFLSLWNSVYNQKVRPFILKCRKYYTDSDNSGTQQDDKAYSYIPLAYAYWNSELEFDSDVNVQRITQISYIGQRAVGAD